MSFKKLFQTKIKQFIGICRLKLKRQEEMVVLMVDGGFCSTIVKYALGRCFEKKLGIKVKYDLTWFETHGMDCDCKFKREFDLTTVFPNLDFEIATNEEIAFYKKYFYFNNEFPYRYNKSLFEKKKPLYYDGYCENWQYFDLVKEELLQSLDFSSLKLNEENQKILNDITKQEASVAVHVRRGDYVNLGLCILTPQYYISAINNIIETVNPIKPHFYFFSNGMDWVRENITSKLPDNISYSFVETNDNDTGYIDLYLISKCKHQISSNSSFGFWGGFLNQNKEKIVIIPEKWTPSEDLDAHYAHRIPKWIVLPC